jgi:hypothetical protein
MLSSIVENNSRAPLSATESISSSLMTRDTGCIVKIVTLCHRLHLRLSITAVECISMSMTSRRASPGIIESPNFPSQVVRIASAPTSTPNEACGVSKQCRISYPPISKHSFAAILTAVLHRSLSRLRLTLLHSPSKPSGSARLVKAEYEYFCGRRYRPGLVAVILNLLMFCQMHLSCQMQIF